VTASAAGSTALAPVQRAGKAQERCGSSLAKRQAPRGERLTQQPCRLGADAVKATKLSRGDLRQLLEAGVSLGGKGSQSRLADLGRESDLVLIATGQGDRPLSVYPREAQLTPLEVVGGLLADPRG
jgi:hypothetical protein